MCLNMFLFKHVFFGEIGKHVARFEPVILVSETWIANIEPLKYFLLVGFEGGDSPY